MKDKLDLWLTARQTMRLLMHQYINPMEQKAQEMNIPGHAWSPIIAARMFAPDPISVKRMRVRIPYNAPAHYEKQLVELKKVGCLTDAAEGEYYLTQYGQAAFTEFIQVANTHLEKLTPIVDEEINRLVLILSRLVQFILVTQPPPCRYSILASRNIDQGPGGHPIVRLDQFLTDLTAFRDDAHLAAWSEYSVHPHTWDILGLIWSGKACSFKEILETVRPRDWLEDQTACSIEELLTLGWIEGVADFHLSAEGRVVRDMAEKRTNEFFFKPWEILTAGELDQTDKYLKQINSAQESLIYKGS